MKYKVAKKNEAGKWTNHGNIAVNKFGNLSLGLRVTPELKAMIAETDGWVNFALFEDKPKTNNPEDPNNKPPF